jgi:hypothetical protein
MHWDELDEQGGLDGQGTARYKLRRGSTDSNNGVASKECEKEKGSTRRKRARVGKSKGSMGVL